ncbi:MAG TPA: Mur ligase domain-containing protein, partial [Trueperaceae bacterium]
MKSHIHFMGIGGIGMSFLARWYAAEGHPVSGCDLAESAEIQALRREGIPACAGHDPDHLRAATPGPGGLPPVDALVYSMAVPDDHPELQRARAAGLKVCRRIDLLGHLLTTRQAIAVTGTHGKSTTTGMIAQI